MTNENKYTEARANIKKIFEALNHFDAQEVCAFYAAGLYEADKIDADEREELFEYNNDLFVKKHLDLI